MLNGFDCAGCNAGMASGRHGCGEAGSVLQLVGKPLHSVPPCLMRTSRVLWGKPNLPAGCTSVLPPTTRTPAHPVCRDALWTQYACRCTAPWPLTLPCAGALLCCDARLLLWRRCWRACQLAPRQPPSWTHCSASWRTAMQRCWPRRHLCWSCLRQTLCQRSPHRWGWCWAGAGLDLGWWVISAGRSRRSPMLPRAAVSQHVEAETLTRTPYLP